MSTPEVPAPVQAVVDAINDADTHAFVAAFTEDGQVDDWGNVRSGSEGVRAWALSDAIGQRATMKVLDASTEGDVTTTTFEWSSDKFNGTSNGIFTVRDGLVSEFRIPPNH